MFGLVARSSSALSRLALSDTVGRHRKVGFGPTTQFDPFASPTSISRTSSGRRASRLTGR